MENLAVLGMFIEPTFIKILLAEGLIIALNEIFTPDSKLISHLGIVGGYAFACYKFLGILVQILKMFYLIGIEKIEN